mgnify:FL=1
MHYTQIKYKIPQKFKKDEGVLHLLRKITYIFFQIHQNNLGMFC